MNRKRAGIFTCLIVMAVIAILTVVNTGKYGVIYEDMAGHDTIFGVGRWISISDNMIFNRIQAENFIDYIQYDDKVGEIEVKAGSSIKVPVTVNEKGMYSIAITYQVKNAKVINADITVQVKDYIYNAGLTVLWKDTEGEYATDRYGNELSKEQINVDEYVTDYLYAADTAGKNVLLMDLDAGITEIEIISETQDFIIKEILILKQSEIEEYQEYMEKEEIVYSDDEVLLVIEGESYNIKSDSFIHGKGLKNPALSPYESEQRKINVLDASSWNSAGQKILWEFSVPQAGYYQIGFLYSQYSEANKYTYRDIEIDGVVLHSKLKAIPFAPTKLDKYENYILEDDQEPIYVYLEKGRHTIAMKAVIGPMEKAYYDTLLIMQELSDIGMDLKKLTAGVTDKNRTWDMEKYLPEVPEKLAAIADSIDALYSYLSEIAGKEAVYANDLLYASETIQKLLKDTRTLPNKIELLNEGDSSVSSALGKVLRKFTEQPLSIDRIYLFQNTSLPKDQVSFFTKLSESIRSLFRTFLPGAGSNEYAADISKDSVELKVWVNMSIQYAEILQQLVDSQYNSVYGTNIQLSIMPNSQKLVLANATDTNPDVVLGIGFYQPYDFAIRGAVKNLLEYEDFLEFYNEEYNLEGLAPLCYDDGVYGAVDSIDFQVMFYRKDIFEKLDLSIPDTWDEVIQMMPELLRYSMNFNSPLANNLGFKSFNATGPFIYQNNGSFYQDNGLSVAFKEEESVDGFTMMTDLFRVYGLSEYIANFYNSFRYGEVPIGISGFSDYIKLSVAAPELTGKWDIALTPGTYDENQDIVRYQAADSTASMIFSNTNNEEEAWRFLKWWLSADTQLKFSYLLESTYGAEYRWNTANLKAFQELPYNKEHKEVILEQLTWQKENVRHPAGYMVERESSNIWNKVVADGKSLIASIDRSTIVSDREIIRKLKEFGYIDSQGTVIKEYKINTVEELKQLLLDKEDIQ